MNCDFPCRKTRGIDFRVGTLWVRSSGEKSSKIAFLGRGLELWTFFLCIGVINGVLQMIQLLDSSKSANQEKSYRKNCDSGNWVKKSLFWLFLRRH